MFCGDFGERLVWESQLCVAIRDAFPVTEGHTLVLPRRHVATYFDASAEEQQDLWRGVTAVKALLDREFSPAGYNVGFNAGEAAGQTVMHLHIHVIPRRLGDTDDPRGGVRGVIPARQKYGPAKSGAASDGAGRAAGIDAAFIDVSSESLVPRLRTELRGAQSADLVVAFVQASGLALLQDDLVDALARGARVRLITGDYLGITSADALRTLLSLAQEHLGLEVWVYACAPGESFHPKAYLFRHDARSVVLVGSSNLSRTALTTGGEWNLAVTDAGGGPTPDIERAIERVLGRPNVQRLTRAWPEDNNEEYEARAPVPPPAPEPRQRPPAPHIVQREALAALAETRRAGHTRGLVVLATGLGKTFLSAFDFRAMRGRRALFVAHRSEILDQARAAWARVFPDKVLGVMAGGVHDIDADIVFASVMTLGRDHHLARFAPDHFDYIVFDEFHHAAAATYRRILAHFEPAFLLGLTATPDRTDGAPLMHLCDDNLVISRDLVTGISRGLLVPFHYFGVKDEVDFSPIPWRSGRFDPDELTRRVATEARAEQALREVCRHAPAQGRSAIAFCCSTRHADFMADHFRRHGIAAAAVHSASTSAPRAESLRRLRAGDLEILCAVDIFNEGVDVPDINTVLMLRPTESPIVFLQQLGRGLRPADGKPHLTVIDFIGNHRSFLQKPQALVYLTGRDLPVFAALEEIRQGTLDLPSGCHVEVETEAIDLLSSLAKISRDDVLLYEYEAFKGQHGRRPTAGELYDAGVHFKPIKERFSSWFDFVHRQGDLADDEQRVLRRHEAWFSDLLRTQMTKAYKMVALQALLDTDSLHGETTCRESAERSWRIARENVLLARELQDDTGRQRLDETFIAKWREMPLSIWTDARGTSRSWFRLERDRFVSLLEVADEDRPIFDSMTEEMVTARLREHLDRIRRRMSAASVGAPIPLRVSHAGGRPILRFDRERRPDTPDGDVLVSVEGTDYELHFRKVAVNKAIVPGEGNNNVLASILRGWFGPAAGQPGTHHVVHLEPTDAGWRLSPDHAEDTARAADVLPFPKLPYYAELEVACGAFRETDRLSEATEWLAVDTAREVRPERHFIVRASGDSMDGGSMPIKDGDLVLCEWHRGGSAQDIAGKPFLLVGHPDSATSFAVMKIPVRRGGRWYLESQNPAYPPKEVDPDTRLEPVARVLDVVREAEGLALWSTYNRDQIAAAFGSENNPSWRVGHRDIDLHGEPHTILMVNLKKGIDIPPEHRYADRFLSRREFQWESQASTAAHSAKGRRILNHERDGRHIHLFVRYRSKQDFTYCGTVRYQRHESEKPIRVWFELDRELPEALWRIWNA